MKILNFKQVAEKTRLSKSTIRNLLKQGKFPGKIQMSVRAVGFLESEIDDFIAERVAARGQS